MARAYRVRGAAADAEGATAAALWEAGCRAVHLDDADLVAVFERPEALTGPLPPGGAWEDVDEGDHVAAYFEGLEAVDTGAIVVAPTHRRVTLGAGQRVLWLDPGMAFGTGHHETTRLALAALGDPGRDLRGLRVLDVGAGSGVLAIAADLLGAAEALGLDNDPAAIPVARANALLNRSRARFELADFARARIEPRSVDLLLANLFAEAHRDFLHAYAAALAPGGRALLTGIQHGLETLLDAPLTAPGRPLLRCLARRREGDWWLLELGREERA
jgi:ribosomal protein L11 methyltransferase